MFLLTKTGQNFTIQKLIILISLLIPSIATEDAVTKKKLEKDIEDTLLSVKELEDFIGKSRKDGESNMVLGDERKEKGKK